MKPPLPAPAAGAASATQPPPLPKAVPGRGSGFPRRLAVVLCFGVLGWLMARRGGLEPVALGGLVFLALAAGVIGRSVYTRALAICNPALRREHGAGAIRRAVDAGFLMLIPFTVLTVLAELRLDWNAALAFASTGIMLGGAMVGAELAKLGRLSGLGALLPSLGAAILSGAWIALCVWVLQLIDMLAQ